MGSWSLFLSLLLLSLSVCSAESDAPSPQSANDKFLGNWMKFLSPVLKDLTMLDISLPGTHDTMSYDLSTTVTDGANDVPLRASSILHSLHKLGNASTVGEFGRNTSQTQGLNITRQLVNGVRFLDFRIGWTAPPDRSSLIKWKYDWYCVHFMQTHNISMDYLQEVHDFMVAHPEEVIVVFMSFHGSACGSSATYPLASKKNMNNFWNDVMTLFDGMMFDTRISQMNTTTIGELVETNQRVIFYISDYPTFTDNSPYAMDSCSIDNDIPDNYYDYFVNSEATNAKDKEINKFSLMQMGCSSPIGLQAQVVYLPPDEGGNEAAQECAASYDIPGMTEWCPLTLLANGLLKNYYSQKSLDLVITEQLSFPNAIYIDGFDEEGSIRTGTGLFGIQEKTYTHSDPFGQHEKEEKKTKRKVQVASDHEDTRFCYVDTILLWNVRKSCALKSVDECPLFDALLAKRRTINPFQKWDDTYHGRLDTDWPPILTGDYHRNTTM